MTGEFIVRGVPTSLAQDGWWLACDRPELPSQTAGTRNRWNRSQQVTPPALAALVVLVTLADWLFWGYAPGLSLSIFCWALFFAAFWVRRSKTKPTRSAVLLALSSLPLIEHFQALSFGFQLAGLLGAVAWLQLPSTATAATLTKAGLHLLGRMPSAGIRSLLAHLRRQARARAHGTPLKSHLANWGFPTGGTLILVALLLEANPLLGQHLTRLTEFSLDPVPLLQRGLFWSGTALLIWPFLTAPRPKANSKTKKDSSSAKVIFSLGINAGSVLRALVLFNLILAVQTVMDLSILFGGADLPDGMTLATYAHRGAYPLLLTAMLAGGFALASRPYLDSHNSLTPLMMLWLGQNALLGLTSLMRLDLYVESFGLTYLRSYAMIWIVLVVVGLLLTSWQILMARSSLWLLKRCAALGLGTLYFCSFVNFASLIAYQNLTTSNKTGTDWHYLCALGPLAATGITAAQQDRPFITVPKDYTPCWQPPKNSPNWREWGFRSWRVFSYATPKVDGGSAASEAP